MVKLKNKHVNDYLDWVKILIGINTTAIGAMFFNFSSGAMLGIEEKVASGSFLISLLSFVVLYASLIDHKSLKTNRLPMKSKVPLILGLFFFVISFGSLTVEMIFS